MVIRQQEDMTCVEFVELQRLHGVQVYVINLHELLEIRTVTIMCTFESRLQNLRPELESRESPLLTQKWMFMRCCSGGLLDQSHPTGGGP